MLRQPQPVDRAARIRRRAFRVQDAGAQLAAPLLRVDDGMRVLDACAAPGGKTTHYRRTRGARPRPRWTSDDDAARARAREPGPGCGLAGVACAWSRGRRRRPVALVGRAARSIASLPTCRARRRASCAAIRTASGCGARATSKASRRSSSALLDGALAAARARRAAALRDVLGVRARKTSARWPTFCRGARDALRESISLPAACPIAAANSCLRTEAAGHNQDGFFYALAPQGVNACSGACEWIRARPPRCRAAVSAPTWRPTAAGTVYCSLPGMLLPSRPSPSPRAPSARAAARSCWLRSPRSWLLPLSAMAARADVDPGQGRGAAHRGRRGPAERRVRLLASIPRSRRRCRTAFPCTSCWSSSYRAARWYWFDEKVAQTAYTLPRVVHRAHPPVPRARAACSRRRSTSLEEVRALRRPRDVAPGRRGGRGDEGHALRRGASACGWT